MKTQISKHPFYQSKVGRTEREILEKLSVVCGFDETVGIIDYLPDVPTIEIGVLDQTEMSPKSMPRFIEDKKVIISLMNKNAPLSFHRINRSEFPIDFLISVVQPLLEHWIEVVEIIRSYFTENESWQSIVDKYIEHWKSLTNTNCV